MASGEARLSSQGASGDARDASDAGRVSTWEQTGTGRGGGKTATPKKERKNGGGRPRGFNLSVTGHQKKKGPSVWTTYLTAWG